MSKAFDKELLKQDLYLILGISEEATEKDILKGYRKKALKCHPDKNPDNPKAAELFHQLSKALEILTDAAARIAYDKTRKAKKAAEERNILLDSKRKKFKQDLEAREKAANETCKKAEEEAVEANLQREIERLQKEGSRLLEEEQKKLREELKKSKPENELDDVNTEESCKLKLKWKSAKNDAENGGYNQTNLNDILGSHGTIAALLISSKRNGTAVVEFDKHGVSSTINNETGLTDNPFSLIWLSGKSTDMPLSENSSSSTDIFSASDNLKTGASEKRNIQDFESLVLRKMRQAEERKKLIEEMTREDETG